MSDGTMTMIGVWHGEVQAACVHTGMEGECAEEVANWIRNGVEETHLVPVEIARAFLLKPWPGIEAAKATGEQS